MATVLLLATARSVSAEVENQGQLWFLATARGPISGRWLAYLEAQPRISGSGMEQLILRPAVGYQLTKRWSLWQGYGWTPSFDPFRGENRIYQQSQVETPRGELPVHLVNRTRLEERWIEGVSGVSLRLRHMLRVVYPLDETKTWSLVAYDEPFVTLNRASGGPLPGFDRNRAFLGVGRGLGSGVNLEVGYLNQFVNTAPGNSDLLTHTALVWLDYLW